MYLDPNSSTAPLLERALLKIDAGAASIVVRSTYGFMTTALYDTLFPSASWIGLVAFLALAMFCLRIFGVALRRSIRFSDATLEAWAVQRKIGKYYDSYQWQKVTWIGLGLLLYVLTFAQARFDFLILSVACISAGAIGILTWRRVAADKSKPKPAPRFRKVLLDTSSKTASRAAPQVSSAL